MNLAALAKHMEEHNTGFSEAMCLGMMMAMVMSSKWSNRKGWLKIDNPPCPLLWLDKGIFLKLNGIGKCVL